MKENLKEILVLEYRNYYNHFIDSTTKVVACVACTFQISIILCCNIKTQSQEIIRRIQIVIYCNIHYSTKNRKHFKTRSKLRNIQSTG